MTQDNQPHAVVPAAPQPPDAGERRAILEQLDTTMLVEASAGSGKTSSMVGRMVRLLAEGRCTVDTLAAITFTRKSAAELRSRFHAALERAAREADGEARQRLAAGAEHVERCYIGTIHSFCARLLRERPVEAEVDLAFTELDETTDQRLRREAWDNYVAGRIAAADPLLAELDDLGLSLGDLGPAFQEFADYPDVARWPAAEVELPDLATARAALETYAVALAALVPELPDDPGNDTLIPKCRRVVRRVRQADLSRPAELVDLLAEFGSVKVVQRNWPGGKAQAVAEQARWQQFAAEVAQPLVARWREKRYPVVLRVLQAAMADYERLRREAGGLNYQDLLLRAAALLRDKPAVRRYFRRRFTHLLVDEFQDTDPIQAEVMLLAAADDPQQTDWRACRPVPGSLFVVGDPKQSIYRFRRADIVTYSEVKRIIQAHGQVVTLWSNFRSTRPVVEWVNRAFDDVFPAAATAYAPERFPMESAHASQPVSEPGVYSLMLPEGLRNAELVEYEAEQIAAIIAAAVHPGRGAAAQRPGDFLIVSMRKRNLGLYARKLAERSIPCQVTGGTVLNEVPELGWLATLVAALVEPENPVALVAVLRGPLFGTSDVELYRYRAAGGRFTLLGGEEDLRLAGPDAPLGDALHRLHRYGRWLRRLPPLAALERMVADLGLSAAAAARPGGNVAAGSLARALELVRAAQAQMHGLDQLAEFLRQLATHDEPRDGLPALPSTEPPVRIMNLHQAKGLEAPVVFLVDPTGYADHDVRLCVDRRGKESCGYLAIHGPAQGWQSGPLLACPPGWDDLAAEEARFGAAERDRQFYVAATRAGRQLIVTCPAKPERRNAWEYFREDLAGQPAVELPGEVPPPIVSETPGVMAPAQPALAEIDDRWRHAAAPTYAVAAAKHLALSGARPLVAAGEHGTEWGSVIHCLLEAAMRQPEGSLERLARGRLESEGLDPALTERAINTVWRVMQSDIWRRARRATRCLVEVPFHLCQMPDEATSPTPTLVRGVMDLVFREPAGWVIVDYKTDAQPLGALPSLVDHHRPQLAAYAAAWRAMTAEPVAETGLYFTHLEHYVRL
jgi:ATP-dependent helicase/nuclease subunit A